ncbi:heavy metal transport/detoxification superfamily protein [Wolffia australiana]
MGMLGNAATKLGILKKKKNRKTFQTVIVKVKMDCNGCERKVKKALSSMKGAQTVAVDTKQQRAEVTGYVDAKDVLRRLRAVDKRGEIWPFVSCPHPASVYDGKAPPGQVRHVDTAAVAPPGPMAVHGQAISQAFSDENPNACAIM